MAKCTVTDVINFIGAVHDQWQLYSDNASDYSLGRPIGFGASSIVYQAEYHPSAGYPVPCALKVLDLDSLPAHSLRLLRRETQLMSLSKHPNVLRVRGTWIDGSKLYIALRLMKSGSIADVVHYGWPGGVSEEVAKCILKQALEGLNYLHINGFIHRDVKAANLLIDDDGTVLLGDLGVAAALNDEDYPPVKSAIAPNSNVATPRTPTRSNAGKSKRKSFVGTPCWMAPEVISQRNYDTKADIWSLGITALELAQGRAPRSREPPHKVLMRTIQDDPPTLDRKGGTFKYSKNFKEIIQSCLIKDPSKRPTAEELLHTAFFKGSKKKGYLVGALLHGLPPLVDRQERRRIPSEISHLSMESWDFSQASVDFPSASVRVKGPLDDSVFEMDESRDMTRSPENDRPATLSHAPTSDERAEGDESLSGSIDSTSSTSPPSSYPKDSIHIPTLALMHPLITSRSSPPMSDPSPSSSFRGWNKPRRIGSQRSLEWEQQQDAPPETGSPSLVTHPQITPG